MMVVSMVQSSIRLHLHICIQLTREQCQNIEVYTVDDTKLR